MKVFKRFKNANVEIVDSYKQIKTDNRKFDLINADASVGTKTKDEHFNIFPDIFRICKDRSALLLIIIPGKSEIVLKKIPNSFNDLHIKNRKKHLFQYLGSFAIAKQLFLM